MNDNIYMDTNIAGSMNDNINMNSIIAGSMNDNINLHRQYNSRVNECYICNINS
jgi:hypothetical protein